MAISWSRVQTGDLQYGSQRSWPLGHDSSSYNVGSEISENFLRNISFPRCISPFILVLDVLAYCLSRDSPGMLQFGPFGKRLPLSHFANIQSCNSKFWALSVLNKFVKVKKKKVLALTIPKLEKGLFQLIFTSYLGIFAIFKLGNCTSFSMLKIFKRHWSISTILNIPGNWLKKHPFHFTLQ